MYGFSDLMFLDTSGEEVRIDHLDCNDSRRRLYYKFTGQGWVWNCFNCGKSGFAPCSSGERGKMYIQQQLPFNEETKEEKDFHLPWDFSTLIPDREKQWLTSYGITEEEIDTYRIGYSPSSGRIILPIYDGEKLLGFQGRSLDYGQVKYLTWKRENTDLIFQSRRVEGDRVVVVEDMLSAIKVGRVVPSIAILGSPQKAGKGVILKVRLYPLVVIWLDRDKVKTGLLWASQLKLLGHETRVVWTDRDPKAYAEKFIVQKVYS